LRNRRLQSRATSGPRRQKRGLCFSAPAKPPTEAAFSFLELFAKQVCLSHAGRSARFVNPYALRWIDPAKNGDAVPDYWSRFDADSPERDLMFKASEVASGALTAFSGLYAKTWLFQPDNFQSLPWHKEYWYADGDRERLDRVTFAKDVASVISELANVAKEQGDPIFEPMGHAWNSAHLSSSPRLMIQGFAAQCIVCADASMDALLSDRRDTREMAVLLTMAYENLFLVEIECAPLIHGQSLARKAGIARHKLDPKAKDKRFVKARWDEWQRNPGTYKTLEAFARDMLDKVEHLEGNTQVIARWVRSWRREVTQPAE